MIRNVSNDSERLRASSKYLGRGGFGLPIRIRKRDNFDAAGRFIMPDTNLKAPDVSFVRAERLKKSVRYFAELVPDLVVDIKSQSDRVKSVEKKIRKFLELGAKVGILIDPDELTVTVYRSTDEPLVLENEDILTVTELFPGWELPISELWPPVFNENEF